LEATITARADTILHIPKLTLLNVIGVKRGADGTIWHEVRYDGQIGYVRLRSGVGVEIPAVSEMIVVPEYRRQITGVYGQPNRASRLTTLQGYGGVVERADHLHVGLVNGTIVTLHTQAFQVANWVRVTRWRAGGESDTINRPSGPMYLNNEYLMSKITSIDPKFDDTVRRFKEIFEANRYVYTKIGNEAGIPAEIVAILHYRENTSDFLGEVFGVHLHNGQPLGSPTTIEPRGINFNNFHDAAVHALTHGRGNIINLLHITPNMQDRVAMLTFIEIFNGAGYFNIGVPSPYIFSGTNIYTGGKFSADGVFDPNLVDAQAGAYILLRAIMP